MKIATIGPVHPFRGGISLYTTLLVRHLRQSHQVKLFTFRRLYPRLLFPGSTRPDPSRSWIAEEAEAALDGVNPVTWLRTARSMLSSKPDLVLLQWWTPFWWPLYATVARHARRAGVPVLTIAHQLIEPDSSFFEWFMTRSALRLTDGLMVMTEEEVGMAKRVLPGKPVRLTPLPPFQSSEPTPLSRDQARQQLGIDPEQRLLLFFGFVRRYKGLGYLLQALAQVPEVNLLVAGEFWENESSYHKQIQQLGLGERVRLVNRYIRNEETAAYFTAADALVLPYLSGSQSAVAATAISYDLPIIATTIGGLGETIIEGETGLLVPPANSDRLAQAVASYFDENLGPGFREAIKHQRQRLTWKGLVRDIEELGQELLAAKTTGGANAGS
jgi:glycosyltransferase involved in cell wall biosynthesis